MIYIWKNGEMVGECISMREAVRVFKVSRPSIKTSLETGVLISGVWWFSYDFGAIPPSHNVKRQSTQKTKDASELLKIEHEILTYYAEKLGLSNVFELLDVIKKNSTKITTEGYEQANKIELQDVYGDDSRYSATDEEYWHKYLCGKWHV